MKNEVELEIVIDEKYTDPHVTIRTGATTQQVDNIICAIENASGAEYPQIAAYLEDKLVFISQSDIVRIYTEGHDVLLQTKDNTYTVRRTMTGLEETLDPAVFLRVSLYEIINLFKVRRFDLNMSGTVGVEFDCGIRSWVSRSCVKKIKEMLANSAVSEV